MSFRHTNRHRSSPPVVVMSDINEVVDPTDSTQMDCQLHIPDTEASASFSDDEEDTELKHYNVVPDRDVVFELDYNFFIRVSSVVLTITSECFRKMLTRRSWKATLNAAQRLRRGSIYQNRMHMQCIDSSALSSLIRIRPLDFSKSQAGTLERRHSLPLASCAILHKFRLLPMC